MSVHRRKTKSAVTWRVQWRDEANRQRSRSFSRKADADAWDAKVKLAKRQGELAILDAGRKQLAELIEEWWRLYATPNLAPKTLRIYAGLRDRYVMPRLGAMQLRALTPERLQAFSVDLAADGVGAETIRKTLAMLQGVLERGVEWGWLPRNPVRHVRKPAAGRSQTIDPPGPLAIERMRWEFRRHGRLRDATLIAVLGYAGLRPGEALALRWRDIRDRTIVIDKALSLGEERSTKTGRRRVVSLTAPLAADLAEWRLASGRPDESALIFPTSAGTPWSDVDFRNWRRRRFKPTAAAVGLQIRPYDLRHAFASLLLAEQRNPADVAGQMGHSMQTLFSTYAHVIEELRDLERVDAEAQIRSARVAAATADVASVLPSTEASEAGMATEQAKTPH
jgi:integrase